tara:strand:+ start:237 stop:1463 length:1227 start_codon:yes stop_codon:yes gene_type:complete
MIELRYCKSCVYPSIAVNLKLDDEQICSACRSREKFKELTEKYWDNRRKKFQKLIQESKKNNKSNYDCIIPVSGGKDSYYQTHIACKEFDLKPLLVTYDGNNWLPEGKHNRERMKEVFNADHLMWSPSVEILKKLNRIAFKKMGDMNWQNHCGIGTIPIINAVKFKIPLIIWGETEWDVAGMYQPDDFVEFSARARHEHIVRGFEWNDFLNDPEDSLTEKDLIWAKYPSDAEILKVGVRGIYIGNFFRWDGSEHVKLMKKMYSWKPAEKPFERTYRNFSNLDDRYENGIHDLMKFVKFGYGRCSDHASKDVRNGHMDREEGIKLVKKYDHVISSDLEHWLEYVGMDKLEFWKIADTFRNPRVWFIKNNEWWKNNLWGGYSSYGKVHLNKKQIEEFNNRQKKILDRSNF